jgi:hypothetical protein
MIEEAAEEEDATANNHAEEDNEDEHEDDSSTWTIHSAQAISDMQQKEQAQEKSFRHKASISGGDEASSSNNNNNNNTTTTNLNLNHSVAEFWENEFQRRELQAQNDDDGGGDLESSSSSEEGVCGADQEQCDKGDDHGPSHPPKAVDHKDHAIKEQYRPNAVPQFSMSSTINSLPSADEPPASNTTHTNTITSASSEEHSPTATMTTTMDRTSLPGAYAESPDLLDTRRSSVVKQVLATLGNEQDDLEMGTASSNFSHVMTETPTLASTTTTTTSTISRISTSEQSAECKDNNNNNFQEGEEVPSGDYEEHGIPSAKTVSDAEAIIYAQDVERDFFKRNQMLILVVGVLSIVLTCTLVVVLAKDDPHEYTGDPRCKNLDEETNVAVHCLCSNTTRNYLDRFEGEDEHYQSYTAILSILRNESIIKEDLQVVPESCLPENLSILFLSYNHDKIQMQDRSTLPRALLLRSYAVNMIYLRMGGLYWDRADNWLTWDAAGACSFHGIGYVSLLLFVRYICYVASRPCFGICCGILLLLRLIRFILSFFFSLHTYIRTHILHRCFFLSVTTELVLPSNNVVGTIASEIGLLSQLRTIDLSGNPGVVGTIPTELASIASLSEYLFSSHVWNK